MSSALQRSDNDILTVTISSGTSLSGGIDLGPARVLALRMPTAWTAASLTFQASDDGTTYYNMYDSTGAEMTATTAASRWLAFAPADFKSVRYLKVRSGTSGTPVNQGANRTMTLVVGAV